MNKVRILHVINSLCVGGIEQTVVNICNNLDKDKYEIHLLVLTETHLDLLERINKNVNVHICHLRHHKHAVIDIAYLFLSIRKLKEILKQISPDIIHTHVYQYNIFPFLVTMYWSGLKFKHVHTIHTSGLHYAGKTLGHRIKLHVEKKCYHTFSTKLICVSKEVWRKTFKAWGNSCGEMDIIENGVDMTLFDKNKYPLKNDDKFVISYVARLVDGKNHTTLLKAFKLLNNKYGNIYLWLIGDGNLKDELEAYTKENKLENNVCFLGNINNVPYMLSQASIAAFPSEYEGFSVAMVEMMAMGLPVVCSRIQCFKDLLGEDGALYFSVHDSEELAKQIEKLYLSKALLEKYIDNSLRISSRYSIENMVQKHDYKYTNIVNNEL